MEPTIIQKIKESAEYTRYARNKSQLDKNNKVKESQSGIMGEYVASVGKMKVKLESGDVVYVDALSKGGRGRGQEVTISAVRSQNPVARWK